jgi:alpha-beta hydrolase superfamily lysophospholipase
VNDDIAFVERNLHTSETKGILVMMRNFRIIASPLFFIGILAFVLNCAIPPETTDAPIEVIQEAWEKNIIATPELTSALSKGKIEMIPGPNSVDIYLRVFGESGKKTPVVMSHGLQSHSGWFAQSAAFMAGLGHPVYSMDRRGSGLSRAPRGDLKDFMIMLEDIHAVANFVKKRHVKDKIYILGHCFGAIPAAAYACEYPDNVKGLILTTPAIYTKTEPSFFWKLRILLAPSGSGNFMVPNPLETSQFTELKTYENFIESDTLSLKASSGDFYYEVHRTRKFIHQNIHQLTMPVIMGITAEDPICDNRRNVNFFHEIPAADNTLIEYNDARHILEFSTEREKYFDDLAYWLNRRDKT